MTRGPTHGRPDRAQPLANPTRASKGVFMRTLRLSLVGTVTLVLLLGAVPSLAQNGHDTAVTGTLSCHLAGGMTADGDTSVTLERFPTECIAVFDDPRVSGTARSDITEACFKGAASSDACVLWGTIELSGPDGTWVGTVGSIPDGTLSTLPAWSVMEGTGEYEGWTYWMHTPDQSDPSAKATGVVYEGPLPPWAESLPLAPAE